MAPADLRGLPHDVADRRCLELESDIWEHLHDAGEPAAAREPLGRFLRGAGADPRPMLIADERWNS